jgi:hypothetical protein
MYMYLNGGGGEIWDGNDDNGKKCTYIHFDA